VSVFERAYADTVKTMTISREANMKEQMTVPVKLIEAIAQVGVDFGCGAYVLEEKYTEMARDLLYNRNKRIIEMGKNPFDGIS
jgi:hypothetical protein